jgi:hypothetical protein
LKAAITQAPSAAQILNAVDDTADVTVYRAPEAGSIIPNPMITNPPPLVEMSEPDINSPRMRDQIPLLNQGSSVSLTITGEHLDMVTVVRVALTGPDGQTDRLLPQINSYRIDSPQRMTVDLNTSGLGFGDIYTLMVENCAGEPASTAFEVRPSGIRVDAYAPSDVNPGSIYTFTLCGLNLANATVAVNRLYFTLHIEEQRDDHISGLLVVNENAPTGVFQTYDINGGEIQLLLRVVPPDALTTLAPNQVPGVHVIDAGATPLGEPKVGQRLLPEVIVFPAEDEANPGWVGPKYAFKIPIRSSDGSPVYQGPPIYLQPLQWRAGFVNPSPPSGSAQPNQLGSITVNFKLLDMNFTKMLGFCGLLAKADTGGACVQGLPPGVVRTLGMATLNFYLRVDLQLKFSVQVILTPTGQIRVAVSWPTICVRAYAGVEVVGGVGALIAINYCPVTRGVFSPSIGFEGYLQDGLFSQWRGAQLVLDNHSCFTTVGGPEHLDRFGNPTTSNMAWSRQRLWYHGCCPNNRLELFATEVAEGLGLTGVFFQWGSKTFTLPPKTGGLGHRIHDRLVLFDLTASPDNEVRLESPLVEPRITEVYWEVGGLRANQVDVTKGVPVNLRVTVVMPDRPEADGVQLAVTVRATRDAVRSSSCVTAPAQVFSETRALTRAQQHTFTLPVPVGLASGCQAGPLYPLAYTATYSLDFNAGNHFLGCGSTDPTWSLSPDVLYVFSTPPTVSVTIGSFAAVPLNGEIDVPVTVSGGSATLQFEPTGRARFVVSGVEQDTLTLSSSQSVRVRGKIVSAVDDVRLVAKVGGSTVASEAFSVVAIQKVEWVATTSPLDPNTHPAASVGQRIFPEQVGLILQNSVKVRATITPAVAGVTVFFRSIDVDDPSANTSPVDEDQNTSAPNYRQDNRGTPKDGKFVVSVSNEESSATTVSAGVARAEALFEVTMQPGDNFRVVATCIDQNASNPTIDLTQVQAQQNDGNMSTGMARVKDAMGNFISSDLTTVAAVKASGVLTVWRYLHVEIGTMDSLPTSDTDPERNFIEGNIVGIDNNGSILTVQPDPAHPLALDDGSPHLGGSGNSLGNGRFERGGIVIGTAAGQQVAIVGANLVGNGVNTSSTPPTEYVQVATNMIGFQLMASNQPTLTGTVRRMGVFQGQSGFRLSINVPANVYVGGQLAVAGETFTVTATNGSDVVVNRVPTLPFFLVDDDVAQSPFLQVPPMGNNAQGGTPFALMQTSDDANRNLYAPAYVVPKYDLRTLGTASFNRNVEPGLDHANQVRAQTTTSSEGYWIVYLQGAFQDLTFTRVTTPTGTVEQGDADPIGEVVTGGGVTRGAIGGRTSAVVNPDGSLSQIGGSTIYVETLRDVQAFNNLDCLAITVIHESGHQFGLLDVKTGQGGGIMEPCSATIQKSFTADHLNAIRKRPHSQGG